MPHRCDVALFATHTQDLVINPPFHISLNRIVESLQEEQESHVLLQCDFIPSILHLCAVCLVATHTQPRVIQLLFQRTRTLNVESLQSGF